MNHYFDGNLQSAINDVLLDRAKATHRWTCLNKPILHASAGQASQSDGASLCFTVDDHAVAKVLAIGSYVAKTAVISTGRRESGDLAGGSIRAERPAHVGAVRR